MFNKENLDFLSTSPGNYIFKNKSNKSEFGKFSSIFHVLASLAILLFYFISYIYGKEIVLPEPNYNLDLYNRIMNS